MKREEDGGEGVTGRRTSPGDGEVRRERRSREARRPRVWEREWASCPRACRLVRALSPRSHKAWAGGETERRTRPEREDKGGERNGEKSGRGGRAEGEGGISDSGEDPQPETRRGDGARKSR